MIRNFVLAGFGVLATHCAAPYLNVATVDLYEIRNPNGRPGFAAVFSAWAWWSLTHQRIPSNAPLAGGSEQRVRAEINKAMTNTPHACPDRWLVRDITADENARVAITGYCASDAELESASDE